MKLLKNTAAVLALAFMLVASCKKDSKMTQGPSKEGSRADLTKDSIFLYAKQTYLWYDALPEYQVFNPRGFADLNDEVEALKTYKINPANNQPYDKYSFIDQGEVSGELGGLGGDYGFSVNYSDGDPNDLRIKYVYAGSPAAEKGLKRGDRIINLAGRTDLDGTVQANIDWINNAVFGTNPTVSLTVKKADGSTADVIVTRGEYPINPILYKNVYTVNGKKVGYFVLNMFVQISTEENAPTVFKSQLDDLFNYFEGQHVTEMIVDLRYNGGGSVETADYLVNHLAPSGTSGVMHIDYYNSIMQKNQATILKNQPFKYNGQWYTEFDLDYSPSSFTTNFSKIGSLNLSRVYFLVTGSTASASELTINCLKPVVDVKLIGRTTYGKPVGFFPIRIDKYDLYIPQFQTKNKEGNGDYFDGMAVDKSDYDDISTDFGDPSERYLAYALGYANKGTFSFSNADKVSSVKTPANRMSSEEVQQVTRELGRNQFKGMVRKLKKE